LNRADGSPLELRLNSDGDFDLDGEQDLVIRPFELEERPGGIGLTSLINSDFAAALMTVRQDWPQIWAVLGNDLPNEDEVWLGKDRVIRWPHMPPEDEALILLRAEPEQSEYHGLQARSLMSITTKGRKDYGVPIGWWKPITKLEELPAPNPASFVVLKPYQGSKTKGLLIGYNGWKNKRPGMVSRPRLEREFINQIEQHGVMYLQDWHPPMTYEENNIILRLLFGRRFGDPAWIPLGGLYNMRREVLVHGASNTTMGSAICE
jgi:hypothetical protein